MPTGPMVKRVKRKASSGSYLLSVTYARLAYNRISKQRSSKDEAE